MKITFEIEDPIMAGFLCGILYKEDGYALATYPLSGEKLTDGNTVRLPRALFPQQDKEETK